MSARVLKQALSSHVPSSVADGRIGGVCVSASGHSLPPPRPEATDSRAITFSRRAIALGAGWLGCFGSGAADDQAVEWAFDPPPHRRRSGFLCMCAGCSDAPENAARAAGVFASNMLILVSRALRERPADARLYSAGGALTDALTRALDWFTTLYVR